MAKLGTDHSCGEFGCKGCIIQGARWILIRLLSQPLSILQDELIPDIVSGEGNPSLPIESQGD